jgi:hypothetical protein
VKNKLRKIVLSIVLIYAHAFPSSGLIQESKSLQELEDEGEIHIGI